MGWEGTFTGGEATYRETVENGFIVAEGRMSLGFDDNPFGENTVAYPSFQILKVHEGYPMEVTDTGSIGVRPSADKRPIAHFVADENPNVYDTVSYILAPWNVNLGKSGWKSVARIPNAFRASDGSESSVCFLYADRALALERGDIRIVYKAFASRIPNCLFDWAYRAGDLDMLNDSSKEWGIAGRFDFRDKGLPICASHIGKKLEERFGERMLTGEGSTIQVPRKTN